MAILKVALHSATSDCRAWMAENPSLDPKQSGVLERIARDNTPKDKNLLKSLLEEPALQEAAIEDDFSQPISVTNVGNAVVYRYIMALLKKEVDRIEKVRRGEVEGVLVDLS
jgi:hypothetical protein